VTHVESVITSKTLYYKHCFKTNFGDIVKM